MKECMVSTDTIKQALAEASVFQIAVRGRTHDPNKGFPETSGLVVQDVINFIALVIEEKHEGFPTIEFVQEANKEIKKEFEKEGLL